MRELGIAGAVRSKVNRTATSGAGAVTAEDFVNRGVDAGTPNSLWVAGFTYVSAWTGWCYAALVMDVFARRIVGHCVSTKMDKKMAASAFGMAVWGRVNEGHDDLRGLVRHNDKGSQYTADDFVELLALHGVRASIGTVGDSYGNALAESVNGTYKTKLLKRFGPWKDDRHLALETARWVCWHNNKRISERNGYMTPVEIERIWYNDGVDGRKAGKNRFYNSLLNSVRFTQTYGFRRVKIWLLIKKGIYKNGKAILRIMQKHGLLAEIRRRKPCQKGITRFKTYENLLNQDFKASKPNENG